MRTIHQLHRAVSSPIGDLITFRALPTASVDYIDPFLFLNHHGPQVYPPHNHGLPFGPHPHRGMETVTFIIDGDIAHQDNGGHQSVVQAGGVQWMTAGRGLIHAEISSDEFKRKGGPMEILQLWLNLPARLKMTEPFYQGLQVDQIPVIAEDEGRVRIQLISGSWGEQPAAFHPATDVSLRVMYFQAGGKLQLTVPAAHNIFFYVIRGEFEAGGRTVKALHLAEFNHDSDTLSISTSSESILLFGHAQPLNEPVVAQGPFVMNTEEEIIAAYDDYRRGKFGSWNF